MTFSLKSMQLLAVVLLIAVYHAAAFRFAARSMPRSMATVTMMSDAPSPDAAPAAPAAAAPSTGKGFGTVKKSEKAEVVLDAGTKTYQSQSKRGVPEYNIFLRPQNGTDVEWVPVGSMTIPRDTKVATAVYEVEKELLAGTFKLYPKLKAFQELRADKNNVFEYGYCLKAFPDEMITQLVKPTMEEKTMGSVFKNWLGKITSPMDTSDINNPGQMTIKQ